MTSRVFRSLAGRVTAELMKGDSLAAIRARLADALAQVDAEMASEQAAA